MQAVEVPSFQTSQLGWPPQNSPQGNQDVLASILETVLASKTSSDDGSGGSRAPEFLRAHKKGTKVVGSGCNNNNGRSIEELMALDPKKVKRILANRQSAAKSKERKLALTAGLENRLAAVQEETEGLEKLQGNLAADISILSQFNHKLMEEAKQLQEQLSKLTVQKQVLIKELTHAQKVLKMPNAIPQPPPAPSSVDAHPLPKLHVAMDLPKTTITAPVCMAALTNEPVIPPEMETPPVSKQKQAQLVPTQSMDTAPAGPGSGSHSAPSNTMSMAQPGVVGSLPNEAPPTMALHSVMPAPHQPAQAPAMQVTQQAQQQPIQTPVHATIAAGQVVLAAAQSNTPVSFHGAWQSQELNNTIGQFVQCQQLGPFTTYTNASGAPATGQTPGNATFGMVLDLAPAGPAGAQQQGTCAGGALAPAYYSQHTADLHQQHASFPQPGIQSVQQQQQQHQMQMMCGMQQATGTLVSHHTAVCTGTPVSAPLHGYNPSTLPGGVVAPAQTVGLQGTSGSASQYANLHCSGGGGMPLNGNDFTPLQFSTSGQLATGMSIGLPTVQQTNPGVIQMPAVPGNQQQPQPQQHTTHIVHTQHVESGLDRYEFLDRGNNNVTAFMIAGSPSTATCGNESVSPTAAGALGQQHQGINISTSSASSQQSLSNLHPGVPDAALWSHHLQLQQQLEASLKYTAMLKQQLEQQTAWLQQTQHENLTALLNKQHATDGNAVNMA